MFGFLKQKTPDELFLENYTGTENFLEYKTYEHLLFLADTCTFDNVLEKYSVSGVKSFFDIKLLDSKGNLFGSFSPLDSRLFSNSTQEVTFILQELENLFDLSTKEKYESQKESIQTTVRFFLSLPFSDLDSNDLRIHLTRIYSDGSKYGSINYKIITRSTRDSDSYREFYLFNSKNRITLGLDTISQINLIESIKKTNSFNQLRTLFSELDTIKYKEYCILNTITTIEGRDGESESGTMWSLLKKFVEDQEGKFTSEFKLKFVKSFFNFSLHNFEGVLPQYISDKFYIRLFTNYLKKVVIEKKEMKKIKEEQRRLNAIKAEEERKLKNFQSILNLKPLDKDLKEEINKSTRILEIWAQLNTLNQELSELTKKRS